MSLTVEPATLNDVPALAKIFFSGFNDELFRSLFPPTPPGQEYIEEGYASWITGKEGMQKAKVFVVRGENGMAGDAMNKQSVLMHCRNSNLVYASLVCHSRGQDFETLDRALACTQRDNEPRDDRGDVHRHGRTALQSNGREGAYL